MAKIENIDRQRQADRRTGLLALNADEPRIESNCLTDDELASLVDQQSTAGEQKQYHSHLAACESCYRRWLELSELVQSATTQEKRKNIYKLTQPRQLAWAGSLLAAAASVVLFLNITGEMPPPVVQQPRETGVAREKAVSAEVQNAAKQAIAPSLSLEKSRKVEKTIDALDSETERPGTPPQPAAALKDTSGSGQFSTPQAPLEPAPAKKTLRAKRSMVDALQEEAAIIRSDISVSSQLSEWLEAIQQGCRRGEEDIQFWQKKYLEGKTLLHSKQIAGENTVNDLLPLIKQLQQPSATGPAICERILQRLEPHGRSPKKP